MNTIGLKRLFLSFSTSKNTGVRPGRGGHLEQPEAYLATVRDFLTRAEEKQ
jgi:hypothetical protein